MRHILAAASLLTAFLPALGSVPELEWSSTDYDFGVMREAEGPRTGTVTLVNRGTEPTFISQVRPSCGCTGASYTEDPVMPGDTARVSFTYNPAGRPGRFDKTVKVYVGEDNALTVIHIRGTVIGTPATLQSDYPHEAGPLRMSVATVDFGEVRQGTGRHSYVKLYNQGDEPLTPVVAGAAAGIEIDLATPAIAPGDVGTFSIYLNTPDITQAGPLEETFTVTAGDGSGVSMPLTVKADITPDLSRLDAKALERAPQVKVVPGSLDLGTVASRQPVEWRIEVANTGGSELQVAAVKAVGEGLRIKRRPAEVKRGKSARIEGTLTPGALPEGPFRAWVEIVTDDPVHPVLRVPVSGTVSY